MITGEPRNKVDQIWQTIWTGGITSPISEEPHVEAPHAGNSGDRPREAPHGDVARLLSEAQSRPIPPF